MRISNVKTSWALFAKKVPGVMLDVTSAGDSLHFLKAPEKITNRPSVDFAMTQPWNYSF